MAPKRPEYRKVGDVDVTCELPGGPPMEMAPEGSASGVRLRAAVGR
jgi:hypothetical protein